MSSLTAVSTAPAEPGRAKTKVSPPAAGSRTTRPATALLSMAAGVAVSDVVAGRRGAAELATEE